jgi:hypothetical protein
MKKLIHYVLVLVAVLLPGMALAAAACPCGPICPCGVDCPCENCPHG